MNTAPETPATPETPQNTPAPSAAPRKSRIFGAPAAERTGLSPAAWGVAALIVFVAVGIFAFAGRGKVVPAPTTLQPPDAYAASLPLTNLAMSEAGSISGAKITYLDGHVQNAGSRAITAATLQVVFANDEAMPAAVQTVPLTLLRVTPLYTDTEPLTDAPLKPGDARDFRLAFESIPHNWNQQMPEVRIIRTESK